MTFNFSLEESKAEDFNKAAFFNFFQNESGGKIQLENERVFIAQSVDSTNTRLKALLQESTSIQELHKTILASASQTSGYGRLSRSFYSPDQNGIYFSFIYIPREPAFNPAFYTVSSALAVSLAVEELTGIKPKIKWVNDLYVGDKKACGILAEGFCLPGADSVSAMVIGIGINLHTDAEKLPEEIKKTAGGIFDSTGIKTCSRSQLLAKAIYKCFDFLDSGKAGWKNIVQSYRERSYLDGKSVLVRPLAGDDKSSYRAKVLGISDELELEVECEDGSIKRLSTGEVTLHQD